MAQEVRVPAPRRTQRYLISAFFGVLSSTVAVVAATHLAAAVAIVGIFAVMTGVWWLGYARDGVALLTALLVLLFVLPAPYSVVGLKSVGAPSFLIAGGLGIWWMFERMWPDAEVPSGARPVTLLVGLFAFSWFVSYAVAQQHVHDGIESRGMDRAMMVVVGWAGIALTAVDGTPTRERLDALGRRVVYLGSYVALVAILQSRKLYDLARFTLPGLTIQGDSSSTYDVRSGFDRIKSTTLHPIELAAVLGVLFPLALHYLANAPTKRRRRVMAVCTGLIGLAMPMAVTRTGVLTFGIALLVLIPGWPRAWRRRFVLIGLPCVVAVRLAIPGLLGTLRALFTAASNDPSVTGRTEDFPIVFDLIGRNPVFGMGPATFSPIKYFFLDNQFLGTSVELGAVGAVCMIVLFLGAPLIAGQAAGLSGREEDRLLARSLSAGVIAGFATFFTFDTLAFPVISSLLFLYIGMIGALYRFNFLESRANDAANMASRPGIGTASNTTTTLLVASIGGHLTQLHQLRQRIDDGRVVWVTNDSPQSRSLLAGEEVVWVPYVPPRGLGAAIRMLPTAWRLVRRPGIHRVISTGSAIAVPFLLCAALRGRRPYYIESATRADGPSASGRILALVPRVRLRTQSPSWAKGRWKFVGSVFDGWASEPIRSPRIRKVVVSLGTMQRYQFRALVEQLVAILPRNVEVLWQVGNTEVDDLPIAARSSVLAAELTAAMAAADVVVAHAGTGIALSAMEVGKCPVLVPRRAARGEHVDDHQLQTAQRLGAARLAVVSEVESLAWTHLQRAAARRITPRPDVPPIDLDAEDYVETRN